MKIDLNNKEFKKAFDLVNKTNQSFFLTGKAGTGKSTFLKYIANNVKKNIVVVAPTGIAAINVGAVTIHSFFQFPLRPLLPEDDGIKSFDRKSEKRKLISSLETLIIDEVSMVRADLIDGIDCSLRKNGGDPNLPFGGKQIVLVGDVYQLEPVASKESGEQKILKQLYKSNHFFNAEVLKEMKLYTIVLKEPYRQSDNEFINLLDSIRINQISQNDLDKINRHLISESKVDDYDFALTLTTTNDLAEEVNFSRLGKISKPSFTYTAKVSGAFDENKYPTESELTLKEGAQVIFLKNDIEKRWVNGTIGIICQLSNRLIKVKLQDNTIHQVEPAEWENINYNYNIKKKKIEQEVEGTFEQYPLKLAWAISIHKSQRMTFDKVIIDFGTGAFASGQAYVALSRVTSFTGLYLKQKINPNDIYVDTEIETFAKKYVDFVNKIEKEPYDSETFFNRGIERHNLKDYTGAIEDYTKTLKINPKHADAYNNRGASKANLGEYSEAIKDFTKAIKINPLFAIAYLNRGLMLINKFECERDRIRNSPIEYEYTDFPESYPHYLCEQAIKDFTKAIKIDPAIAETYYNRGLARCYISTYSQVKKAIIDFTKAIEVNPYFAKAFYYRGLAKGRVSDRKAREAIKDFTKALIINPSDSEAYYARGIGMIMLGQYKEAVEDFTKAIENEPSNTYYYDFRGLANLYLREAMMKDLDLFIYGDNNGDNNGYNAWPGGFELCQEAINDFTKVIEDNPNNAEAYGNRGFAKLGLGDKTGGKDDFMTAFEIDPEYFAGYTIDMSYLIRLPTP